MSIISRLTSCSRMAANAGKSTSLFADATTVSELFPHA